MISDEKAAEITKRFYDSLQFESEAKRQAFSIIIRCFLEFGHASLGKILQATKMANFDYNNLGLNPPCTEQDIIDIWNKLSELGILINPANN